MSTPLIFRSLELRNFLSFGQQLQTIELDGPGTVCVRGENLDRSGSNGSGKSAIINALCYALYNKPFDQISLQRLINRTNSVKNTLMEVRLLFDKAGDSYEIYRSRGEEFTIEIRRNGIDITPGKGVIECDAFIEDIIGISYDLFTKTVIFSGSSPPFMQLPIHQQRMQIEELFSITMLSDKAKLLKDEIRQTEQDIKVADAVCVQQQMAIDLHRRQVQEAEQRVSRWETSRRAEITNLRSSLAAAAAVDLDAEKALHDERAALREAGAHLATKLGPLRKDRQHLMHEVEQLLAERAHLEDAKCPYCSQAYLDAPLKLAAKEQELDEKGNRLIEVEAKESELNQEASLKKARLAVVEKSITHANLDDLLKVRENASKLQQQLEQLEQASNPHLEARDAILSQLVSEVDTGKADGLRRRLDHQQFLLKLLTDKNSFLRQRIINQTIPFLNVRLNHHTAVLGLPHVVKFDADMSCTVAEFGRELDFGNLSAGEKKRVNTALMLAFRDVLHHLHAKVNLLFLDELDGALDQNGTDSIIRVLKEKSRDEGMSVFVISHHPSVHGRLDRELVVTKEHGFSRVEWA